MTEWYAVVALGFALGLSLAVPPGPILALSAARAARHGFWPGVVVALGATAGDMTLAAVMGLGVMRLLDGRDTLLAVLGLAGAALMAWFAYGAWKGARTPMAEADRPVGRRGLIAGGFAVGYALAVTSPYNFAWWLSAGTSLFADYGWLVFAAFFAAIAAWAFAFAGMVVLAAGRFRGVVRGVGYASVVLLLGFAGLLAWTSLRALSQ